jgi:hypothetical protein
MSWTSTAVVKIHISLNHHPGHKTEAKGNHTPQKVTDYIDLYKGKAYMSTPRTMPIDNLSERTLEVAWKEETICRYGMYIHNKKGWHGWGVTMMQPRCLLKKRPSFMIWYSLKEATELLKHRWAMAVKRVPGPWLLGYTIALSTVNATIPAQMRKDGHKRITSLVKLVPNSTTGCDS